MADGTPIEWTDATWNIVTGCSVVSPGCTNCYAMRLAGTRLRDLASRKGLTRNVNGNPVWTGQTRTNWEWIDQPLSWGRRRMIFVAAHGDLFHETVDQEEIAVIFGVMIAAHHLRGHVLQVLTKRSARMRQLLQSSQFWEIANSTASSEVLERVDPLARVSTDARATLRGYAPDDPPPGLWLGVSCEDQRRADERVPDLLATPAAIRWVSAEPLLAPIDFRRWLDPTGIRCADVCPDSKYLLVDEISYIAGKNGDAIPFCPRCGQLASATGCDPGLDWIVTGGESGPDARGVPRSAFRAIRDQCAAAGVAYFHKQNGEWIDADEWLDFVEGGGMRVFRTFTGIAPQSLRRPLSFENAQIVAGAFGAPFEHRSDGSTLIRVGKRRAGRLLDGVEHNAFPSVAEHIHG